MRARDLPLLACAALLVAACGKEDPPPVPPPATPPPTSSGIPVSGTPAAEEHSHDPQHGGRVVELGEHEGHLEIVHEATTGTLTAYVYDADMEPTLAEAPVVNLTKAALQVPMTPLGSPGPRADAWKAVHEALKSAPLEGRLRLKIGEKTYQASLEPGRE
jgi:hypothetical protein